jgi:hypothetical protein
MKKYKQPKITVVELDAEQAILQVCKVGGSYIGNFNSTNILCSSGTGIITTCAFTPKGGTGGGTFMSPVNCENSYALRS